MNGLYNVGILLLHCAYRVASLFHPKARQWVEGRIGWEETLLKEMYTWPESRPRIWIHAASLGEFEQGRPLIERIRAQYPLHLVVLSFFSPSGYEMRKHYDQVDYVTYLPIDQPISVGIFLDIIRPDVAIFIKYEFWFNFLKEIQQRYIPLILISALFRSDQIFFKSYGQWFLHILTGFDQIFTQNIESQQLLRSHGILSKVAGDTRIDRVLESVKQEKDYPGIQDFCGDAPILVVGSSWPPDEAIIREWWLAFGRTAGWQIIIAPHDIAENHLQQIEKLFTKKEIIRYSSLSQREEENILLIDNIGMLTYLYRYGKAAFIGGGFGAGIHNTLEPIAYGLPVFFGPKYQKFDEARALIELQGGFSVTFTQQMVDIMQTWTDEATYTKASMAARSYPNQHQGATTIILDWMEKQGLLFRG